MLRRMRLFQSMCMRRKCMLVGVRRGADVDTPTTPNRNAGRSHVELASSHAPRSTPTAPSVQPAPSAQPVVRASKEEVLKTMIDNTREISQNMKQLVTLYQEFASASNPDDQRSLCKTIMQLLNQNKKYTEGMEEKIQSM